MPTALAEVAYSRFVFRAGTTAALGLVETHHTAFRVSVDSADGVDLTRAPFDAHVRRISSPTDYRASQALGSAMREDGIAAVLYVSARDPRRRTNLALFRPCFSCPSPHGDWQTWTCAASGALVEFKRKDPLVRAPPLAFPLERFGVRGTLPSPAV